MPVNFSFNPPFIAHRGASSLCPENTLAAFCQAAAWGYTWLEFDVMLTACGEVIVFHDETLERTTNGRGSVIEKTYAELKTFDAGSWFGEAYRHEAIPCLATLLEWLAGGTLSANIELKAPPGKERELVSKVLALVHAKWPSNKKPPLFSSFSKEVLKELRAQAPLASLGFLLDEWTPSWREDFDSLGCCSLNINEALLTEGLVKTLKADLPSLLAYTVNEADRAKTLLQAGVDAIFTDRYFDQSLYKFS